MDVMTLRRSIITGNHRLPFRERTVVGNPVLFKTNAEMPLRKCDVAFAPVQNFNGYGYPWPGGKGKNLINKYGTDTDNGYVNQKYLGSDGSLVTPTGHWDVLEYVPVSPSTEYTLSGLLVTSKDVCFCEYDSNKEFVKSTIYSATAITFTTDASTSYIRVSKETNGQMQEPQLELGSSFTGYAPYENICPIQGWSGFNVCKTGANLLGGIALANAVVSSMPSATISTDLNRVNFAANATVDHAIVGTADDGKIYGFKFKENTQYTFVMTYDKNDGATRAPNLRVIYTDGTYCDFSYITDATTKEMTITTTEVGKTVKRFYKRNMSGTTHLYYNESGIFEGVLTAQDFEEWSGNIYPIIFPAIGKNLFNPALAEKGYYTDTGAKHAQSSSNYEYRMTNYIPIDGIEKVTVGYANLPSGATKWNSVCWYDENKNFMERSASTSGTNLTVFTVPEGAKYVRANMRTFNNGVEYCFLSYGEEAFEPFDNTEYGGTINIVTGILAIDRKVIIMDGVTGNNQGKMFANKGQSTAVDVYYSQLYCTDNNVATIALTENNADLFICSHAPTLVWKDNIIVSSPYLVTFSVLYLSSGINRQQPRLVFKKSLGVNTTAKVNAFLQEQYAAGTPVTYTVPLANPIVYQLDPETITAIRGMNSVYSDANGNIEVTYLKRG